MRKAARLVHGGIIAEVVASCEQVAFVAGLTVALAAVTRCDPVVPGGARMIRGAVALWIIDVMSVRCVVASTHASR